MALFSGVAQYLTLDIHGRTIGKMMVAAYDLKVDPSIPEIHASSIQSLLTALGGLTHFPSPLLIISVMILAIVITYSQSTPMARWQKGGLIAFNAVFVALHVLVPAIT